MDLQASILWQQRPVWKALLTFEEMVTQAMATQALGTEQASCILMKTRLATKSDSLCVLPHLHCTSQT